MASGALGIGERINGVNLGNWLVLERWMKPGIFAASGEADEIWLHRATESAELETLLTRHRDTYITEADFRNIAAHGYLVMAEQFPLFRLIPDRWLMGWYRFFVRWNERRIRRTDFTGATSCAAIAFSCLPSTRNPTHRGSTHGTSTTSGTPTGWRATAPISDIPPKGAKASEHPRNRPTWY